MDVSFIRKRRDFMACVRLSMSAELPGCSFCAIALRDQIQNQAVSKNAWAAADRRAEKPANGNRASIQMDVRFSVQGGDQSFEASLRISCAVTGKRPSASGPMFSR